MVRMAWAILLVVFLAGCGGGGGGASAPIETGNVIRQLQVGDYLVYSITGIAEGEIEGPVTGTLTRLTQDTPLAPIYGIRTLQIVGTFDLRINDIPILSSITNYVGQDVLGNTIKVGWSTASGSYYVVSFDTIPYAYLSPVSVGESWWYNVTYNDGSSCYVSCSILAYEPINGRMAYKSEEIARTVSETSKIVEWFIPDWGYPIRTKIVVQSGLTHLELTATLQSKNF